MLRYVHDVDAHAERAPAESEGKLNAGIATRTALDKIADLFGLCVLVLSSRRCAVIRAVGVSAGALQSLVE